MKKLTCLLFAICLSLSVFAETKNGIIYQNIRKETINSNTQESLNVAEVVTGEYKGAYCLMAITYNKKTKTGTCYGIYSKDKQKLLSLAFDVESLDGNEYTYESTLSYLIEKNKQIELIEDTIEVEDSSIIKYKTYFYN